MRLPKQTIMPNKPSELIRIAMSKLALGEDFLTDRSESTAVKMNALARFYEGDIEGGLRLWNEPVPEIMAGKRTIFGADKRSKEFVADMRLLADDLEAHGL